MRKLFKICFLAVLIFSNIGCWDVRDVGNRAFLTGIGLDVSDNPNFKYKVTISLPKPIKLRNRSIELVSIHQTVEAETIAEAFEKLQNTLSRDISFTHLRGVVVGERLARQQSFKDIMSFLEKNPEVAMRMKLFFVQGGQAKEVLSIAPVFDRFVTGELVSLAESGRELRTVRTQSFNDLVHSLRGTNGTAYGTRLIMSEQNGKKVIERSGGALFKYWRLIGWLDEEEAEAVNLVEKDNTKAIVLVKMGAGQYTYSINRKVVKITPQLKNGSLQLLVQTKVSGEVVETQGKTLDLTETKNINKLQTAVSQTLANMAANAVYKSQKDFGADYLDFGKALELKMPKVYREINWAKVYPDIPIEVEVDARVARSGITE